MRRRQKGGLPSMYFNTTAKEPSASAGVDSFNGIPRSAIPVSNYKGGTRRTRRGGSRRGGRRRRRTRKKGGFTPSVMGGFVTAVSKNLVPVAMFSGYKLITKKKGRV